MKILHVWDQAGVGSLLCLYLKQHGHNALLLHRKVFDKFGIYHYYSKFNVVRLVLGGPMNFYVTVLKTIKKLKPDILHVHSLDNLLIFRPLLRKMRVVVHFHGSELRQGRVKIFKRIKSSLVLVSTPDLLDYIKDAEWLPNPVDLQLFKPLGKPRRHKAIYFKLSYEDPNEAIKRSPIPVDIVERCIAYPELPSILNDYEYFLDRYAIPYYSKTALEALACGCKVIRWDGQIIRDLPLNHNPHYVIRKLLKLYNDLIGYV